MRSAPLLAALTVTAALLTSCGGDAATTPLDSTTTAGTPAPPATATPGNPTDPLTQAPPPGGAPADRVAPEPPVSDQPVTPVPAPEGGDITPTAVASPPAGDRLAWCTALIAVPNANEDGGSIAPADHLRTAAGLRNAAETPGMPAEVEEFVLGMATVSELFAASNGVPSEADRAMVQDAFASIGPASEVGGAACPEVFDMPTGG
ncbi:hypothetical protein CLV92_103225 [Kineococcus xinjiangensis]|uniref:DUF732 domain-containing protein n=1 Tax=Kineococcus xinjiangensis TaxID=512762 RepID=A0A2S6IU37_9ACTN|nr:hypothetical protein [Kineococcus xinjiangensis]PPK97690.1 hypothetical protein CLV92_103225 [Kineococcus xinjiangensis]